MFLISFFSIFIYWWASHPRQNRRNSFSNKLNPTTHSVPNYNSLVHQPAARLEYFINKYDKMMLYIFIRSLNNYIHVNRQLWCITPKLNKYDKLWNWSYLLPAWYTIKLLTVKVLLHNDYIRTDGQIKMWKTEKLIAEKYKLFW